MSSSKRLPCQKEACAIQKCLQGKQTLKFCLISIVLHKKNVLKIQINLIKLKLTLMSILFWPETQIVEIVDLVDQKNSYIGTASRVMLASGQILNSQEGDGFRQKPLEKADLIVKMSGPAGQF